MDGLVGSDEMYITFSESGNGINKCFVVATGDDGIQITTICTEVISSNNDVRGITGAVNIPSESGFDGLTLVGLNGVRYKVVVNADGQLELTEW